MTTPKISILKTGEESEDAYLYIMLILGQRIYGLSNGNESEKFGIEVLYTGGVLSSC